MREWTIDKINILESIGTAHTALPPLFSEAGAKASRAFHEQIE